MKPQTTILKPCMRRRRATLAVAVGTLLLAGAVVRADITLTNRVAATPKHIFTFDDTGLPAQLEIRASSNEIPLVWRSATNLPPAMLRRIGRGPQLAAPMRIEAVVNRAMFVAKAGAPATLQKTEKGVEAAATWQAGALKGRLRLLYTEDGAMTGQITYDAGAVKLERLDLALELGGPVDTALAGNPVAALAANPLPANFGSLSPAPGVLWRDGSVPAGDGGMFKGRVPHFFLGNGDRGFTWLAHAADGFVIGDKEPSMSVERNREEVTIWRIALVNAPAKAGERTAGFTLLTHPGRPRAAGRRVQQWQPWADSAATPALDASARGPLGGGNSLIRADAGSVYEAAATRALLAGPAGGDALSAAATLADRFPIGLFRYLSASHTALAAQLRPNAAALASAGASPGPDRMALGRALLHDIGVDLGGLASRIQAAGVVRVLEEFGVFEDDGNTEFLPYWRTDGILRFGEEFGAPDGSKGNFDVTKVNPAGRIRVSVFLRREKRSQFPPGGEIRNNVLFVVVNEGTNAVREQLHILNPSYVFGGINKTPLRFAFSQLNYTRIPPASDWRRSEVLATIPDIDEKYIQGRVTKVRAQELAELGALMDLESNGYVPMVSQGADKAITANQDVESSKNEGYGPIYVPARGMRLLYASGARVAGVVGNVYTWKKNAAPGPRDTPGTRVSLSVPVYVFEGQVKVSENPVAEKANRLIKKLQTDADGSFRCVLAPNIDRDLSRAGHTILAEIDGKMYPDAHIPDLKGSHYPTVAVESGEWMEYNISSPGLPAADVPPAPPTAPGAAPVATAPSAPATPAAGQAWTSPLLGMEFVWIPPGTFKMGSPDTEAGRGTNETLHQVTLTKGFWMGKYEVTQEQWQKIMGYNPSHFGYAGGKAPVENTTFDSIALEHPNSGASFLARLNERSKESGVRYRLPTEAEWEYACRAGTQSAIYTGPLTIKGALNGPELDAIAWYGGNSGVSYIGGFDTSHWIERQFDALRSGTHPVGEKKPNAWGLYDMLGNVSEWCYDIYTNLPPDSVTNPVISPYDTNRDRKPLSRIVVRGGSWYRIASGCRSAFRQPGDDVPPIDNYTGFRVVCDR